MKKMLSILVLAMFVIGMLPLAFAVNAEPTRVSAADDDAGDADSDADEDTDEGVEPVRIRTRLVESAREVLTEQTTPRLRCIEVCKSEDVAPEKCRAFCDLDKVENCQERCVNEGVGEERCKAYCFGKRVATVARQISESPEARERLREIVKERPFLARAVAEKAAEYKLRKADKLAENPQVREFLKSLDGERVKVFLNLPRAKQKEIVQMKTVEAVKKLERYKVRVVKKDDLLRKRAIVTEKLETAKKNYERAKNEFQKWKDFHAEKKGKFVDAKRKLAACADSDSEECQKLEAESVERAKEYLENSANMAIEHINKVMERVAGSDDFTEEEASKIVGELQNAVDALEESKTKLESAETRDEIKEIANEIESLWKRIRNRVKLHAARVVETKVGEIVVRSEQLEKKLDCSLQAMEEQDIEVSDIEAKLDTFSEKIDEARTKYREGKAMLEVAKDAEEAKTLLEDGKALIREAHKALVEAHKILVEIHKDIRAAGGKVIACAADEDVDEDEEVVVEEIEIELEEESDDEDSEDEEESDDDDNEEASDEDGEEASDEAGDSE